MAKNTAKNALPCNVAARKRYRAKNYKTIVLSLKIADFNAIAKTAGSEKNVAKFMTAATLKAIEK